MKNRYLPLAFLSICLTLCGFHCGVECFTIPISITRGEAFSLDNRGQEPVVLEAPAHGFLSAYGIQVQLECEFAEGSGDTWTSDCDMLQLTTPIRECRIYTLLDMPNGYAAGDDVSALFRFVDRNARPLKYRPLSEAPALIPQNLFPDIKAKFDFLLIQPPSQNGTCQFEFRMETTDSTLLSITTNPILLQ
ncbi:MAG: hypothetical protein JNM22_15135 [Saprospiraceae bacterium]|nr:hypothetical protein [Saprospiraceae bacterium]